MKRERLFLLVALSFALFAMVSAVCADSEQNGFDYSAEKMECRFQSSAFDMDEAEKNRGLLGSVTDSDWSIGPEDAVLTIIEYADFQCPYCADASLSLIEYQKEHSSEVRLVFRHFPLSFHEKAVPAALAANAAGYQGMFFEAEEFLFEKQGEWSALENNDVFEEWLIREFGNFSDLDFDLWYLAFSDSDNETDIRNHYSQVIRTGIISGTPTVFLNYADSNYMFDNASLDNFLEKLKANEHSLSECPDIVIHEETAYTAVLETEIGDIRIELFPDTTPNAVNSFVFLAESGWYDGAVISHGYDDYVWTAESVENPGYSFDAEFFKTRLFDGPGYIGFDGSASDQDAGRFFITGDIRQYLEGKIRSDSSKMDVSEDAVSEYITEKIIRLSKMNSLFGRVFDEDMEKLMLLDNCTVINNIRIDQ